VLLAVVGPIQLVDSVESMMLSTYLNRVVECCINPRQQVVVVSKYCIVASNICGSSLSKEVVSYDLSGP
jgi:hypothetical protein